MRQSDGGLDERRRHGAVSAEPQHRVDGVERDPRHGEEEDDHEDALRRLRLRVTHPGGRAGRVVHVYDVHRQHSDGHLPDLKHTPPHLAVMAEKDHSCPRLKLRDATLRSQDAKGEAKIRRTKLGCEARMRRAKLGCEERSDSFFAS